MKNSAALGRGKGFLIDVQTLVLNYFVTWIPCWTIRKPLLMLAGIKIGKGSRVLMGTQFQGAGKIRIGCHSYINSRCHLDGRGGLQIGNNVNISNYSKIITASHDMHSACFAYRTGEVVIKDYCWLGTGAVVLDRTVLEEGCVVSANSVIKGNTTRMGVYAGVPAELVKLRDLKGEYDVSWKPFFL